MKRVLAFEGDAELAKEMKASFSRRGIVLEVYVEAEAGIERSFAKRPDIILLSIELPGTNGFTICNSLKKNNYLKSIPLILMSSECSEKTFEEHRKMKTRAEDYLKKPFEFDELFEKMEQFFKGARNRPLSLESENFEETGRDSTPLDEIADSVDGAFENLRTGKSVLPSRTIPHPESSAWEISTDDEEKISQAVKASESSTNDSWGALEKELENKAEEHDEEPENSVAEEPENSVAEEPERIPGKSAPLKSWEALEKDLEEKVSSDAQEPEESIPNESWLVLDQDLDVRVGEEPKTGKQSKPPTEQAWKFSIKDLEEEEEDEQPVSKAEPSWEFTIKDLDDEDRGLNRKLKLPKIPTGDGAAQELHSGKVSGDGGRPATKAVHDKVSQQSVALKGEQKRLLIVFWSPDPKVRGCCFGFPVSEDQAKLKSEADNIMTIGRSPNNTVVVDESILSDEHFRLERVGDQTFIRDNGSGCGTFIADELITHRALRGGEKIRCGETTFFFLAKQAITDQLQAIIRELLEVDQHTQTLSRLALREQLAPLVEEAEHSPESLTVACVNVDDVRRIAYKYGDLIAESVIEELAMVIKMTTPMGFVGRDIGTGLLVVLPGTSQQKAIRLAERWRFEFGMVEITSIKGKVTATMSVGLVQWRPGFALTDLISRAYRLLWEAQEAGGNMVASRDPRLSIVASEEDL